MKITKEQKRENFTKEVKQTLFVMGYDIIRRHKNKLHIIRKEQIQNNRKLEQQTQILYPVYKSLEILFKKKELSILNKGYKYVTNDKNKRNTLNTFTVELENAIPNIPQNEILNTDCKEFLIREVEETIIKSKNNTKKIK